MINKEKIYQLLKIILIVINILSFTNIIYVSKLWKLSFLIVLALIIFLELYRKNTSFKLLKAFFICVIIFVIGILLLFKKELSIAYTISQGSLYMTELSNSSNINRNVLILDSYHVSTPKYYSSLNKTLDSLSKEGFTLFYEFIYQNKEDSLSIKKMHYILGEEYKSMEKYQRKYKDNPYLDVQNMDSILSFFSKRKNVDLTMRGFLELYENQKPIDFKNKIDQQLLKSIIYDKREKLVAKEISDSSIDKIVVLYGADHRKSIIEELQKLDSRWKIISTKILNK